jgi:hypothetical protein
MHNEGEHEAIRRRRQLADLTAGEPRQDDDASVERLTDEDNTVPAGNSRDHIIEICIVEANYWMGTLSQWDLLRHLRPAIIGE